MTRGVKVGVRSVLLVMLLVRRFQRTLLTRCSVVPPRERDGARSTMDGAAVQQARVLRFRSSPKRWTFVDVVVVDSGEELGPKSGEELQLCFAAAELPVALAEGALLRFTGTEEPRRTRRGVRAYQCDKLLELTPPAIECAPRGSAGQRSAALRRTPTTRSRAVRVAARARMRRGIASSPRGCWPPLVRRRCRAARACWMWAAAAASSLLSCTADAACARHC